MDDHQVALDEEVSSPVEDTISSEEPTRSISRDRPGSRFNKMGRFGTQSMVLG